MDTDTVLFEFDHIYPEVTTASNLPIVILYATLGVQQTHDLHTFLKAEAQAGKIRYAVRYSFPKSNSLNTPSTAPNIGGYGVELAIKSLEYKTVDDSKVEGVESRKVQIEENEEEIKGFLFGVLQKRKPHLTTQLASFKSFLLSKNEQFENLKVWDLKGKVCSPRTHGIHRYWLSGCTTNKISFQSPETHERIQSKLSYACSVTLKSASKQHVKK